VKLTASMIGFDSGVGWAFQQTGQTLLDVIGNKVLELPAQMMLAMANAQIVQTSCRFHETI
jgi:hypothetical protein